MSPTGVRDSTPAGVRAPAVADLFYPADTSRLQALVDRQLAEAAALPGAAVLGDPGRPLPIGLLVPHAGLVYSGVTAAAAWRLLGGPGDRVAGRPAPAGRQAGGRTVVILGTNHGAGWLEGVAAWDAGRWSSPLGDVEVDAVLAGEIVDLGRPFQASRDAHAAEHSIEVQLPFLRAVDPAAMIVPLAVTAGTGPAALEAGRRLGDLLARRRALGRTIILAISSDMAHYPAAAACERATAALLPAIRALDAAALAREEQDLREAGTRGLSCGMCGIEPAVLGLAALSAMGAGTGTPVAAATSADVGGSPDRTVGYLAVRFDP